MLATLAFIIIALRPASTATRSLARGGSPVPSTWRATAVSLVNATFLPVTVLGVPSEPRSRGPLVLDVVERSRDDTTREPLCWPCDSMFEPVRPTRLWPGDQMVLRMTATMAGCTALDPASGAVHIYDRQDVDVRVLGIPRTVHVPRPAPFMIQVATCGTADG